MSAGKNVIKRSIWIENERKKKIDVNENEESLSLKSKIVLNEKKVKF